MHAMAPGGRETSNSCGWGKRASRLAPEPYARAEHERSEALRAASSNDGVGAALHAELAEAAYNHAFAAARLARATSEREDALKSLGEATTQGQELDTSYQKVQQEADALEERARQARAARGAGLGGGISGGRSSGPGT